MLGRATWGLRHDRRPVVVAATLGAIATIVAASCSPTSPAGDDEPSSSGQSSTSTSGTGGTGGECTGGGPGDPSACPYDCSQIDTPQCQIARCCELTGQCQVVSDANGTPCDDGLFCTVGDACVDGACAPGQPNDCGVSHGPCEQVTCSESTLTCTTQTTEDGAPCTDPDNLCQVESTCQDGLCLGTPKDCFLAPVPDECHVSKCNPQSGQCEPVPGNDGQPCVDPNDLCSKFMTCAAGVCQGGTPLNCSCLTQGCVLGVCDPNTGQCTAHNLNSGDPCDDEDTCTVGETCQNGSCTGGTAITTCEPNGDGCCPSGCNAQTDLDCTIQPSCLAIKTANPLAPCGSYTVDPDGSGPSPPLSVFCDMMTDGGGWTLVLNRLVNSDNTGQPDLDVSHGAFDGSRATNWNHDIKLFWPSFTEVVFAAKEGNNCAGCIIGGYDSAIKVSKPTGPLWSAACAGIASPIATTKLVGNGAGQQGTSYMCGTTLGWGSCNGSVCHYGVHHMNTPSDHLWGQNPYNEMHFPSVYSNFAAHGDCCNTTDGDAWCRSCGGGLTPTFNLSSSCCVSSSHDAKSRWTLWVR